ncbi:hypothetical protein RSAG8_10621, partial [Rhizoctonia solani AG-8 WAC10335]
MAVVQHRMPSQRLTSSSSPSREISTSVTSFQKLRHWVAHDTSSEKIIENISPEEAEALWATLHEQGIKLRNESHINDRIREAAVCGNYSVCWRGSPSIPVAKSKGKKGTSQQPDGSLALQSTDPTTGRLTIPGYPPRVVLETAYSQAVLAAQDKACRYLYDSPGKHIHAVVICKLVPIDRKNPEVKLEAWISVWVRMPVNDPASDFPVDPCRHKATWGDHNLIPDESTFSEDASSSHQSTALVEDEIHEFKGKVSWKMPIWNRSGWILFAKEDADEGTDDQAPRELVLNIYDFVRVCSRFPSSYVPRDQQDIKLNLSWLQRQILAEIPVLRGNLPEEPSSDVPQSRKYPGHLRLATAVHNFIKRLTRRNDGGQV